MTFTQHAQVKPEPERISAGLSSSAWRRLMLSWHQIFGQRPIQSHHPSRNSPNDSRSWASRNQAPAEETIVEAEAVAVVEAVVDLAEEAHVVAVEEEVEEEAQEVVLLHEHDDFIPFQISHN